MINTYEIRRQEDIPVIAGSVRRRSFASERVLDAVRGIIDDVRDRGDAALIEATRDFDGVELDIGELEVSSGEAKRAWESLDDETRYALECAACRIAEFQRGCLFPDRETVPRPGVTVGQVGRALERVGIYVPGGRHPYPSTVLMTGIPAKVAGVQEIVFCMPPGADGSVNTSALAATTLVEGSRVFRVGGAQAVAAMAFGTETVPGCLMVAGPGNAYVTVAKRLLNGEVSIDLEAGPSEVAIYIDGTADLSFAAADMLAQLEHDPLSLAVMVSESVEALESGRGVLTALAESEASSGLLEHGAVCFVLCDSRELSLGFVNELAPEHLEVMVSRPEAVLPLVRSAGCVFLGPYSGVAMGDYTAGPSHVLPTGGSAVRHSGLSALSFTRIMNVVSYGREGMQADSGAARVLAGLEGMRWHALSIDMRLKNDGGGTD